MKKDGQPVELKSNVSKRDFLKIAGIVAVAALLTGCKGIKEGINNYLSVTSTPITGSPTPNGTIESDNLKKTQSAIMQTTATSQATDQATARATVTIQPTQADIVTAKETLQLISTEWPKKPEDFLTLIYVPEDQIPTDTKTDPYYRRLTVNSVAQELDKDGNPTGGWILIQPERDPKTGKFPFWYIQNPTGSMQYGYMQDVNSRNKLGLTLAECKALGFNPPEKHVGAGVPAGFMGTVEGITFYPVNTSHPLYTTLGTGSQTVDQRFNMKIDNGLK